MASGKDDQRIGFQNMMKAARGRRFKILILWDLDRLGRSLVDLINNCNELMSLGIDIHFINANMVLNNSPETQFTFHILGAAAQFERNLISRRTKEGIAAAKKRGVRFGSPLKITPAHHPKLIKMWEDGVTIPKMAKAFNVSATTIRRYRRSLGLPARREDHLRDITKRPEWASVALKNKSKYTHINGIEKAMTWSQKKADEYWAKRA
jgi:DNA invertase Pin-like site-specific DNA recombinase